MKTPVGTSFCLGTITDGQLEGKSNWSTSAPEFNEHYRAATGNRIHHLPSRPLLSLTQALYYGAGDRRSIHRRFLLRDARFLPPPALRLVTLEAAK